MYGERLVVPERKVEWRRLGVVVGNKLSGQECWVTEMLEGGGGELREYRRTSTYNLIDRT